MNALVRCAVALFSVMTLSVVDAATITIRADTWFPYNGKPGDTREGYMIDLARLIAARAGHQIDYRQLTWKEALEQTRQGAIDCVVGASREDAEGFRFPDHAWGQSGDTFFAFADRVSPGLTLETLIEHRLAVVKDYAYGESLQHYVDTAPLTQFEMIEGSRDPFAVALMMLATRRVDVVTEDRAVGAERIASLGLSGRVIEVGHTEDAEPIYIACTPARPEGEQYARMFDQGMVAARASGELARILQRYGLNDWQSPRPAAR